MTASRLCDGHTNAPVPAQPEHVQAFPTGPIPKHSQALQTEIEAGFDDLRLNAGQRKQYVMKTLNLRFAPALEKLTREQLESLLNQVEADCLLLEG